MRWEQIQAILWLRWRLSANRFVREGALNVVLSILLLVFFVAAAIGSGVAGFFVGLLVMGKTPPMALLAIWDGVLMAFLFFWMIGLLVEIQRSESIDIAKLLHLPITPSQVFVFNYLASHLTPSLIFFMPGMLGLCAGLVLSAGPLFILVFAVLIAFVFMVTAWTYCLRGWLAALMVNKRRRRAVIVWITIGFIVVCQAPNLLLNSRRFQAKVKSNHPTGKAARPRAPQIPPAVLQAHLFIPPGWVGYSAMALKMGNPGPALGATVAASLLGLLGLRRAYRLTLRFYQGVESGTVSSKPARKPRSKPAGAMLVERRLPWLKDDTAALALATFRGLLRAPELKMALITPVVLVVVFGSLGLSRARAVPPGFVGVLAATAAALTASFSFAPTMANIFGLDRDGFRALVLLPTPRHQVLLAKNLAFFPFVMATGTLMLLLAAVVLRLSPTILLTGLLEVPVAFMSFALVCNLVAILAPYRFAPGSLQAKKPKAVVILANFLVFLTTPLIALPLALPPGLQLLWTYLGWSAWVPVGLVATLLLLVPISLLYWFLLPAQGHLLQKREIIILGKVTEERE